MNRENIKIANKIDSEIKEYESLSTYFDRDDLGVKKSERVVEFLTNCRNLGSSTSKEKLSELFFTKGLDFIKDHIESLEAKIEKLD